MAEEEFGAAESGRRSSTGKRGAKHKNRSASGTATQAELLPEGKLYYRIGEVAKITAIKPHVLRYWETEFRWMSPPKSRSKQRLYRRKDIEMILVIKKLLYDERYTIAGARLRLKEMGLAKALETATPKPGAAESAPQQAAALDIEDVRASYRRIRDELKGIRSLL